MNNYMLPDFATWIRQAYREPESASFTIHNMEVAYQAGRAALEQAARQALETLERASDAGYSVECDETITALREALEQVAPRKTEQWNPMDSSNAETALQMAVVIAHRDTEAAHQQATPQANSQPAPVDMPPLPDPDLRDVGTKPQDVKDFLNGYATEYARLALAARATADSVLEDAARLDWLADYLIGERTDLDEGIVACATIDALRQFADAARKQGGA